jgi:hypothetical protein
MCLTPELFVINSQKKKNFEDLHKCLIHLRCNFITRRSVMAVTNVSSHIYSLTKWAQIIYVHGSVHRINMCLLLTN